MRRQTGIVDLADAAVGGEELARPRSAFALCCAIRSGSVFRPRPSAYAGYGSITVPSSRRACSIGATSAARPGHDAAGHVAVAVQVLRRALHRQVDAERERLLVDRARERVVDDRQDAARRGRRRRSRRTSTQRSVGLIGDSNQTSRVRSLITRSGLGELVERDEPRRDPELRQQIVQQVQRAAVNRRAADDLVARLAVRHQDRRRRAHAGREEQRRLGAIERRQLPLDADDRRVARSANTGTSTIVLRCRRRPPAALSKTNVVVS